MEKMDSMPPYTPKVRRGKSKMQKEFSGGSSLTRTITISQVDDEEMKDMGVDAEHQLHLQLE